MNVESKKAQKRNAKNYETDIIIAEGIETLGYFFCVGHKKKESYRSMRFLTEVASDPGLEPGALRLGVHLPLQNIAKKLQFYYVLSRFGHYFSSKMAIFFAYFE